jgi:hypothetical protein
VDLFEPGSGSQVHDINGGIPPNGLFWTVDFAQASINLSDDGRRLVARVKDLNTIDSFVFLGPSDTAASLDFRVEMRATGEATRLGSGSEVPATDPAAFLGRFFPAKARGRYSARELGFSFKTDGAVTADDTFAEMGFERNGVFL